MPKQIVGGKVNGEFITLAPDEIEDSPPISQEQLNNTKVYMSREEYAKTLPQKIRFMEIGVSWGYYSGLVSELTNPSCVYLLDKYYQDSRCWSWHRFGECKCKPNKHTYDFKPEEHKAWIEKKFSKYNNPVAVEGDCEQTLLTLDQKEFDYIYFDTNNQRKHTEITLNIISKMIPVGGLIGINDYLIYDAINVDRPYGTFQSVNFFLHENKNWSVDAIALHNIGFYDIYLRRNS